MPFAFPLHPVFIILLILPIHVNKSVSFFVFRIWSKAQDQTPKANFFKILFRFSAHSVFIVCGISFQRQRTASNPGQATVETKRVKRPPVFWIPGIIPE
jgi:hypothetical protein